MSTATSWRLNKVYEKFVLKHYANPWHKGPHPNSRYARRGVAVSDACGDKVSIEASIEDDVFTEVWWQGDGCCFTVAASSMLVEYLAGKTVDEMFDFSEDQMFDLFQANIPDSRESCILVPLKALRNLLEDC